MRYERRIDELFSGGKPNREGVVVLDRSDVLDMLGHGDMPVVLNEQHAIDDGRYSHPLTAEQWKRIPEYLDDPVAVFERDDGHMTFITSELVDGKPLIVAVEPRANPTKSFGAKRHLLLTAFVKDRAPLPVRRMMNNGQLRYVDTRKSPKFNINSGLQLPSRDADLRGMRDIVKTGADMFKFRRKNSSTGTRFSRGPGTACRSSRWRRLPRRSCLAGRTRPGSSW